MKLFCFVVAKNEAAKFLPSWINHYRNMFDGVHFFDDQSTDSTPTLAKLAGYDVTVRPDDVPSFRQHEGNFRQHAWDTAVEKLGVQEGDRIFAPDCDEFVMCDRDTLLTLQTPTTFHIDEIWQFGVDGTFKRSDGTWPSNKGIRLVTFDESKRFNETRVGSGSTPEGIPTQYQSDIRLLHYGYAYPGAPSERYERYKNLSGNAHSPGHINSILARPKLKRYEMPTPEVRIG